MALVISDRIKETTTTTGTGTYTLAGAVTGFETFTANLSNSDTTYYCCTDGTDFEVGLGTFTSSGTTLARTTILSSSNSNNAVSWSSGTRTIFCTLPAAKAVFKDASDNVGIGTSPQVPLDVNGQIRSKDGSVDLRMLPIDASNAGIIGTYSNDALVINTNSAERVRIDTSGNVGIGTTTPSAPLDVSGNAEITGTLTAGEVSATTLDIGGTNITATATEINKLDGVTATTTELNYVDVTTLGTVQASKAVTADANGNVLFPDDEELQIGTGGDLKIFHDGTNNIFRGFANPMYIQTDDAIFLTKNNNSETMAKFIGDGAVELYYNNEKNFETHIDGITVGGDKGILQVNGTNASIGTTVAGVHLYADGFRERGFSIFNKALGSSGLVEEFFMGVPYGDSAQPFVIKTNDQNETALKINQLGSVELYNNNSKKLETTSTGATVTGDLTIESTADGGPNLNIKSNDHSDASDFANEGFVNFIADNDANQEVTFGRIGTFPADVTDGTEDGRIRMDIMSNGTIQGAYQFAPGYLFLTSDTHRIQWQNTRGTNFSVDLLTATPTANREITLPDATGTVLTTGNSDSPTTTTSSSDADFVLVDDGGTMKKITPTNLGIGTGASKGFAVAMAIAL